MVSITILPHFINLVKWRQQKNTGFAQKARKARRITIFELELGDATPEGDFPLRVRCSKGTYIRTLCKDIGEHLGCGGCMQELRRVTAGEYTIEESVPLQQLLEEQEPEKWLRNVDTMFRNHPEVVLTPNQEKRCRNGNSFTVSMTDGTYRAYGQNGEFLMLAKVESGVMSTIKSFWEV